MIFIQQACENKIPISSSIVQEKAKLFAKNTQINDFKASSGWLTKLKKRHNIKWKKINGESADIDETTANDWFENKLPKLIQEYEEKDIFNADETGLFFRCLPGVTYAFQNDKCFGGKHSKERITLIIGKNMNWIEKLQLLVIGKLKKLQNVKSLLVEYHFNSKS